MTFWLCQLLSKYFCTQHLSVNQVCQLKKCIPSVVFVNCQDRKQVLYVYIFQIKENFLKTFFLQFNLQALTELDFAYRCVEKSLVEITDEVLLKVKGIACCLFAFVCQISPKVKGHHIINSFNICLFVSMVTIVIQAALGMITCHVYLYPW